MKQHLQINTIPTLNSSQLNNIIYLLIEQWFKTVSAIIEVTQNQTWFARLRTRLLNIFRRETSDRESAMQNHTTNEYSCIKCGCFGKLFRSNRTRTPSSDSSVVRVYSDWSHFFTESVIVKAPGSWGWRPLRTRRRRREPNWLKHTEIISQYVCMLTTF